MKRIKDIAMRMIPVLIVVLLLGIISVFTYQKMIENETNNCWNSLTMATHDMEKEVRIRFSDNLNLLDLTADAIIMKADFNREDTVLRYLGTVQERTIFERIDVIFPDGQILLQTGEYINDEGRLSYQELLEIGPHLSTRSTDSYTGKDVIYYFTPVIVDGVAEAMLIGTILCETLSELIITEYYNQRAQVFLLDCRDGNFWLDNWHDTLGNISSMADRELLREYEGEDFVKDMSEGRSGEIAFYSNTNGKATFMSYMPVEGFSLSIAFGVQEDIIFANVIKMREMFLVVGIMALFLLLGCLIWNIYIVTVSVTNSERAKAAELEKEKNEAKSRFLSSVSHDIRTPINGIVGMLDVIRMRGEVPEHMLDSLRKIDVSAKYLLTLTNDVLDMNELEMGKIVFSSDSINLEELANDIGIIMSPRAKRNGLSYHMDCSKLRHPNVIGSEVHINKILMNLIGNAIKYNKENGGVWVEIEEYDSEEKQAMYRFRVRDNGIGMTEEFQKNMFNAFEQEHAGARTGQMGHGLGLSIVSGLLEQMGGSIAVESKKDVGSTFTVTLQLPFANGVEDREEESAGITELSDANLLLVEDNELNMEIASVMLESAGAKITKAENGKIAVEIFKHANPYTFDCILMDIMMPEMDGYEAAREIRAMEKSDAQMIPIIAMTASTFSEDIKRCREAGMNEHIGKPLDMNTLMVKVAKQLKRYRKR